MLRRGLAALIVFGATGASAHAADLDLPPLSTAEQPRQTPRWEGFSIGAYATALWAPSETGSQFWWPAPWLQWDAPGSFSLSSSAVGGGVQVGSDKQFGNFVIGGSADYGVLAGATSSKSFAGSLASEYVAFPTGTYTSSFSQTLNSLGTFRGRIGYALLPDWLVYATAGLAFGQTTVSNDATLPSGSTVTGTRTGMSIGYAYGAGVQYAMGPNWSLGLEGLGYNLGAKDSVSVANFFTYENVGGVATKLPESVQLVNKTSFEGYELRLTAVYEFDGQDNQPTYQPMTDPNSEVPMTVGTRVGVSMGQSQLTLYDGGGSTRLSRLTYKGATNFTVEPYFQMDLPDWNIYVSGFLGMSHQSGGKLQDEDFPPGISPYSSTDSPLHDGQLQYGVIDIGYNALTTDWYKVGGFAGYTFQYDNYNAFGCTQTASNPEFCGAGDGIGPANLTISDSFNWNAARVGISGSVKLPGGFSVSGDAAWLPFIDFSETNNHYLRMPGDFYAALPGVGSGSMGFQLEAMANYKIAPHFDVGAGVRYWSLTAKGHINFQDAAVGGQAQVADFSSQRAQAFVQTGYHF